MKIRKSGIYKNIPSNEFGIYQQYGWEKVVIEPIAEHKPIVEEVKAEEPVIKEVIEPEPIIEEEIIPKAKKKKKA